MEFLSRWAILKAIEKGWVQRGWPLILGVLLVLLALLLTPLSILFFLVFTISSPETEFTQNQVSSSFPTVARQYLSVYQEAGEKYGVPWEILAAIHKVETNFGQDLRESAVGAKGHTQFMDKTWLGWNYPGGTRLGDLPDSVDITDPKMIKKYGGYGVDGDQDGKADPNNPVDAIYATANYLSKNYRDGKDWFARGGPVWQYNHDYNHYVLKVKEYAEQFAIQKPVSGKDGQMIFPVPEGSITSKYGRRFHPIKKTYLMHEGLDIGKSMGAPLLAVQDGVVVESRPASGYGWIVVIRHGDLETLYAHMYPKDVKVKVGQQVSKGQVIALMGANGRSTGPHLHFEVRKNGVPVNPMPYLNGGEAK